VTAFSEDRLANRHRDSRARDLARHGSASVACLGQSVMLAAVAEHRAGARRRDRNFGRCGRGVRGRRIEHRRRHRRRLVIKRHPHPSMHPNVTWDGGAGTSGSQTCCSRDCYADQRSGRKHRKLTADCAGSVGGSLECHSTPRFWPIRPPQFGSRRRNARAARKVRAVISRHFQSGVRFVIGTAPALWARQIPR
jgi:hypothetical protein